MSVFIELRESAFQNRISLYAIVNSNHIELDSFFSDAFAKFAQKQKSIIDEFYIIKTYGTFVAEFKKTVENEADILQTMYFNCTTQIIDIDTDYSEWFNENIVKIVKKRIEDFNAEGSGWTLSKLIELVIYNNKYEAIRGSSFIVLPNIIKRKRAVINVENTNDNLCFMWSILAALHPEVEFPEIAISYLDFITELNFQCLEYPVELKKIQYFECENFNISINVYGFDDHTMKIYPLRLTKNVKEKHIHLLLLQTIGDNNEINSHYCWIHDISKLLGAQVSKSKVRKYFCDRCLHYFYKEHKLVEHYENCMKQNNCAISLPTNEKSILKFDKYHQKIKVPFCIYADLESVLKPVRTSTFTNSASTQAYQQHEPFSIGYYFKSSYDDSLSYYKMYRGPDCMQWFCKQLYDVYLKVLPIFKTIVPIQMDAKKEQDFTAATKCHICGRNFSINNNNTKNNKVRDHNHMTGEYRGAAHDVCNLTYQDTRVIPVIFHNLSGYDSHFIIIPLMSVFKGKVKIIPLNDQKYIAFEKTVADCYIKLNKNEKLIKFRFLDSFRFMSSSLDKLSSYLPSIHKIISQQEFAKDYPNKTHQELALLERKGIFPYDFIDSLSKLHAIELPPKAAFYSKLTDTDITDDEWNFAKKVWNTFNIQSLGDYADLYLKIDVLLLTDVFENFRSNCMTIYGLDPEHFYTIPGLSWNAMLKYTCVEIELLTEIDKVMFIERGIRGGISQCSKRFARANNRYMGTDFNINDPQSYLIYLDVNNLYGYAMLQDLPLNNFEWVCNVSTLNDINNIIANKSIGCFIEVDLKYPTHLHDKHADYSLCPEKMIPPGGKNTKLLLTLYDKKRYILHHKMLQFVCDQGLIIEKIHRTMKFTQSKWMKPFIDLNTHHRTIATNEFERNLFKLMSNACFGKTMENVRKRVDITLCTDWSGRYGANNMIASPNFKKLKIFNENVVAIEMHPKEIQLNKPIAIGMTVLDISKLSMYDFHYNFMKHNYGTQCDLLYTDTDSFIYQLHEIDFYEEMKLYPERFDTSDYPDNNSYNIIRQNKKVPGLMKDENNGNCLIEFIGLRSKMYSMIVKSKGNIKKAKGVKRNVLNKSITHNDFYKCIQDNCSRLYRSQNSIRSKIHQVFTITQTKLVLSGNDDKRQILADNITTKPWGYRNSNDGISSSSQ